MESTQKAERMAVKTPNLLQLYSSPTPNGIKVACCLEEIKVLRGDFDYEPHSVDIRHHESREPDFLEISPNGKIPAIIDHNAEGLEIRLFESGAILIYLAEKYDCLLPRDPVLKAVTLKWLFFGATGISTKFKLFGFYYHYCVHKMQYCMERHTREVFRLLGVLEEQLKHGKHWIIGDVYTIADICIWPWIMALEHNYGNASKLVFSDFEKFPRVVEWYHRCKIRPASVKGIEICPFFN